MEKDIVSLVEAPPMHWVGDGFPVRSIFSYDSHARELSPFLLLDHGAAKRFEPTGSPRGVGVHPHRGFETVTIALQGQISHRDSSGGGGLIGAGDVQWMTAGAGILHDEFHGPDFTTGGGVLEMVQLWVNLPARHKLTAPGYQTLIAETIPTVALRDEAGSMRIIAGQYGDAVGPARTFTPINLWEVQLRAGRHTTLSLVEGHTLALVVLRGSVCVNQSRQPVNESQMLVLSREHTDVTLVADDDALVLLLSGEPIDEPVVGHGPFVMNSREEIVTSIKDFQAGRFGQMTPT